MTIRFKIFCGMALLVILVSAAYIGTTQGYLGSLFGRYFTEGVPRDINSGQIAGFKDYVMDQMKVKAVNVTLFTAGLALVISYWLSGLITRPLEKLISVMEQVADEQLDTEIPIQQMDEYGQVSNAFNKMTRQMRKTKNGRKRLVEDVAHELRTPLSIVLTKLELVQQKTTPVNPEELLPLHDEVLRLIHLVDELRFLTSAEAGELHLQTQKNNLTSLLTDMVELIQPEAEAHGIHLFGPDHDAEVEVNIDVKRIKQVFLNLVGNSLRYTPAGGEISIRISPSDDPTFVVVIVKDTGPGIPEEEIPHLFDRFYKVDKSERSGGIGLGLAITRQIVILHGGSIEVRNSADGGAEFAVQLPR